jgi:hypothetical protein
MKAQLIGYLLRECQSGQDDKSGEISWQKHKNKMKVLISPK